MGSLPEKYNETFYTGLSLRAGGRGFPPPTMSVVSGYFHRKTEEK